MSSKCETSILCQHSNYIKNINAYQRGNCIWSHLCPLHRSLHSNRVCLDTHWREQNMFLLKIWIKKKRTNTLTCSNHRNIFVMRKVSGIATVYRVTPLAMVHWYTGLLIDSLCIKNFSASLVTGQSILTGKVVSITIRKIESFPTEVIHSPEAFFPLYKSTAFKQFLSSFVDHFLPFCSLTPLKKNFEVSLHMKIRPTLIYKQLGVIVQFSLCSTASCQYCNIDYFSFSM